ncbi:unnamed protein product [Staurois parvus]|uniref:Uncharacterized protein n=1 Tax=Staurois parvus TaxID=386267 RepID=A0ABN9FYJ5_9NEOB|nr:unnamed protein product [Staurois parvus]
MKGTRGISWGPLLTPGPRAEPKFPNGQSTPQKVPGASHGDPLLSPGPRAEPKNRLLTTSWIRGGLTTHGAPRQQGIMGPLCPCPNSKNPMKKVPEASHGAPY